MKFLNVTRRNVKVAAGMVGGLLFMQTLIAPVAYAGPPARKFYRTQTTFDGAHALTACVLGFHMASLWEIFNVSVLEYDTSLGATMDDSGSGPPADVLGWIRTGFNSNGGGPAPGEANCRVWTSSLSSDSGSAVALEPIWNSTTVNPIRPWVATETPCTGSLPVWCVQD